MAVDLMNAKNGDIFLTKDGLSMSYYMAGNSVAYSPYKYCLKSEETGNRYFYSNEGEYFQGKDAKMNLVGFVKSEESKNRELQETISEELSIGWEIVLKIFAWLTFVGCVITFFLLLGDRYLAGYSWIPLVYGIIQIAPIMVFANISISLKEANILKKNILNEIKKSNENKPEEK